LKGGMTVFTIFFALFGLESLLESTIIPEITYSITTLVQGVVFIIIALVFYVYRTPKEVTK
jgi:predicted membrane channel-forming protein YqfA (hemolysin III family)